MQALECSQTETNAHGLFVFQHSQIGAHQSYPWESAFPSWIALTPIHLANAHQYIIPLPLHLEDLNRHDCREGQRATGAHIEA